MAVPLESSDVTTLLVEWRRGDEAAFHALFARLYDELRQRASACLRGERADHTFSTTALVHESYLRLVELERIDWQDRAHFLAIAATTMRRVLVDHARRRSADKRGGGEAFASEASIAIAAADDGGGDALDLLALDDALARLAARDARAARVVELRFFGGLSVEETATVLEISPASVKRDWSFARAWLGRELRGDSVQS